MDRNVCAPLCRTVLGALLPACALGEQMHLICEGTLQHSVKHAVTQSYTRGGFEVTIDPDKGSAATPTFLVTEGLQTLPNRYISQGKTASGSWMFSIDRSTLYLWAARYDSEGTGNSFMGPCAVIEPQI